MGVFNITVEFSDDGTFKQVTANGQVYTIAQWNAQFTDKNPQTNTVTNTYTFAQPGSQTQTGSTGSTKGSTSTTGNKGSTGTTGNKGSEKSSTKVKRAKAGAGT